jgi:hypothetical protein
VWYSSAVIYFSTSTVYFEIFFCLY